LLLPWTVIRSAGNPPARAVYSSPPATQSIPIPPSARIGANDFVRKAFDA
jgi:hypothetical protein